MTGPQIIKTIVGGFFATLLMTAFMYGGVLVGLPELDIAGMLGAAFISGQEAPRYGIEWLLGMFWHFVNGTIIFPVIYASIIHPILRGGHWLRGLIWGILLAVVAGLIVVPIFGRGMLFSNTPAPIMMTSMAVVAHIIYGLTLGIIAGRQPEEIPLPGREMAETKG